MTEETRYHTCTSIFKHLNKTNIVHSEGTKSNYMGLTFETLIKTENDLHILYVEKVKTNTSRMPVTNQQTLYKDVASKFPSRTSFNNLGYESSECWHALVPSKMIV